MLLPQAPGTLATVGRYYQEQGKRHVPELVVMFYAVQVSERQPKSKI